MTIVDSHQHFWDPVEFHLPPPPSEAAVLGRAFLPEDLKPELDKAGVDRTVLVQAYPQSLEMNRWLFARTNEASFVAGVVAWADLTRPDVLGPELDELQAEPKFVGVRHIVEDESDEDWIVRDPILESLRILADRNIPYDMLVKPQHLGNVQRVLDAVGDLRMVIDHIAKPDIARGTWDQWHEPLGRIAANPNTYCKLSGLVTEADWDSWQVSDLAPYVSAVVDMFGVDRVMVGSDWPVCLLAADYQQVWQAMNDNLSGLSELEYEKVFGTNATEFYGL